MLTYTSRLLRINPIGNDQEKSEIARKLFALNEMLYIPGNLIVADCINEYWDRPENDIPYLVHQQTVERLENDLVDAIKKAHEKNLSPQQKEAAQLTVHGLKDAKETYIRDVQKHELFAECNAKPVLSQLEIRFRDIPRDVLLQLVFRTTQIFLKELKRIRAGTYKMPYFTKGAPIPFSFNKNFTPFEQKEKDVQFKWLDGMKFTIAFGKDRSGNRELIGRFLSGELDFKNLGDSAIKVDRNKEEIFLFLAVKEPPQKLVAPKPLDKNLCLGVDVGYNTPIYWGLSNYKASGKIGNGAMIKNKRIAFENIRKRIAEEGTSIQSGHGQKRKMEKLRTLRKNERSFFTNLNRRIAKELVTIALKKGAGVIKLEDSNFENLQKAVVAKIRKENVKESKQGKPRTAQQKAYDQRALQQYRFWSYAQLQKFIIEKGQKYGIEVVYIDHRGTSLYCHVCKLRGCRPEKKNHEFLFFNIACLDKRDGKHHFLRKCDNRKDCPLEQTEFLEKDRTGAQRKNKHWVIDADKNAAFYIASSNRFVKKL